MTALFVSYAHEDTVCAECIRQSLEASGYTVWREPDYPTPRDTSYPYVIENAILGNSALVLVWSVSAAIDAWVERHILCYDGALRRQECLRLRVEDHASLTIKTPASTTKHGEERLVVLSPITYQKLHQYLEESGSSLQKAYEQISSRSVR